MSIEIEASATVYCDECGSTIFEEENCYCDRCYSQFPDGRIETILGNKEYKNKLEELEEYKNSIKDIKKLIPMSYFHNSLPDNINKIIHKLDNNLLRFNE